MNIKETYLRVIGHITLLIFVIRYRGPRQFISLLFHRISRLLTISIDFRSIHKKKKETKISTRNFIQKKTIYFPSLFPILIYSPEIVTKNQTNFTYRKETEYHQIMLKRKFPRLKHIEIPPSHTFEQRMVEGERRRKKERRVVQSRYRVDDLKMKSIRIPRNRDGRDLVTPFEPAFDHVAVRNGARVVPRRGSFVLVSTVFASATSRESRYHGREV